MATLHKVGILFLAKLLAISIGLAGLITGILYSGIGLLYDAMTTGLNAETAMAFMAILYNLSTRVWIGLTTDFQTE